MTNRKRWNNDEESTNNVLLAHRELDEHEKLMRKMKFCEQMKRRNVKKLMEKSENRAK
jgi:hypothetical protein